MAEETEKEGALSAPDLAASAGARNLAAVKDAAAISSGSAGRLAMRRNGGGAEAYKERRRVRRGAE
jgi:hypothetical protein